MSATERIFSKAWPKAHPCTQSKQCKIHPFLTPSKGGTHCVDISGWICKTITNLSSVVQRALRSQSLVSNLFSLCSMCSPATFWLLHEFLDSWQSTPLPGDGITGGVAQSPSFAQCTSKFRIVALSGLQYNGIGTLSAHPSQFSLRNKEQAAALCAVQRQWKSWNSFSSWNPQQQHPNISHRFSPLKMGKPLQPQASRVTRYSWLKREINPSCDSLSTEPPSPDPSWESKNSLLGVILEWDDLDIRITSSDNSLKPYLHPGQFFTLLNTVLGNSWAKDDCASKMLYAWGQNILWKYRTISTCKPDILS